MSIKLRYLVPLLAAVGVVTAPVAATAPDCINTGPTTTQCENPGNAQIVTSPPVRNYNNFPWFFGSGFVIEFGG
jgi:hypothetical protein